MAYHFVGIPKDRRKIPTGEVEAACKKLIEECCTQHGFTLLALETDVDHGHCLVSAPPRWSPAVIVGLLKGYTSRHLRARFPKLKRQWGKEPLWTQAYDVGTAGSVSAAVIRRYIQGCQGQ
ncbi:MAG: IS200/IS605 family transposase [Acidiferrobacter thiooxydans]